jgi:exodeoxyribonuclease V gamma subunit
MAGHEGWTGTDDGGSVAAAGNFMPGVTVYGSNRLENLADALAGVVGRPLADPFRREVILVQSAGMHRWLLRELSRRLGIFANGYFPFPNALADEWFRAVVPEGEEESPFSPRLLPWRILRALPALLAEPSFAELRDYLGGDVHGLRGLQLARRIADAFDRYALHRPEMVLGWEAGEGEAEDWQRRLWRALSDGHPLPHRAAVAREFHARIHRTGDPAGLFPERLCVFGIPSLPPFHLRLLETVSRHAEVHLFFLNPSVEYWGDILPERKVVRRLHRPWSGDAEREHYTVGNPLLASMGKLGQDFFNLLLDRFDTPGEADFSDPGEGTLLSCLQSDILNLRHPGRDEGCPRKEVAAGDASVRLHAVHSPMREMEVLYDQLLDLFRTDPSLTPGDVVVMTPDIEAYAPYVTAVFGSRTAGGGGAAIPWSLSDRRARGENETARSLLSILSLSGSRLGAGEVGELLESPPVANRFGFAPADLELLRRWIGETRIRWGEEPERRGSDDAPDMPGFGGNTWREGLDRLLLGYAMAGDGSTLFGDVLPFDGVEGAAGVLLGRFAEFARLLFARLRRLEERRTLSEWSGELLSLLEAFVDAGEEGEDLQLVRSRLAALGEAALRSGYGEPVPVEVVRHQLETELQAVRGERSFLSGAVTFCEMLPMRSIPFAVVAVVGMNGGAFPRQDRPPAFDRLARDLRPGDRSLPLEDRYLFLEALLSARKVFYASWVGLSIADNSLLPPSPLVSELVDVLSEGFHLPGQGEGEEGDAGERLVVRHKLQPFHPAYFRGGGPGEGGDGLFSYSGENWRALLAREEGRRRRESDTAEGEQPGPRPFLPAPLGAPDEALRHVTLSDLKRFLAAPVKHFLQERLGVTLKENPGGEDDHEPFSLGGLDRYSLEQELLERILAGGDAEGFHRVAEKSGILPPGVPGEAEWEGSLGSVREMAAAVAPLRSGEELPPVPVRLPLGPFHLSGTVRGLRPGGLLKYRCAKVKGKDLVEGWVDRLALQAVDRSRGAGPCRIVGTEGSCLLRPSDDPTAHLLALLELYWQGQSEPLPLFPGASLAYAEERWGSRPSDGEDGAGGGSGAKGGRKGRKGSGTSGGEDPVAKADAAARGKWVTNEFAGYRAEDSDPWNVLAFGECEEVPGGGRFASLAEALFRPIVEHREALS